MNFPRLMARKILHSLDWYFSQIPLLNMIYLFNTNYKQQLLSNVTLRSIVDFTGDGNVNINQLLYRTNQNVAN